MSTFAQVAKSRRPPGKTLVLERWVFADDWSKKPTADVCVGLRLLCDGDKNKARATAEELANETHPLGKSTSIAAWHGNWVDCFNDCIQRQVVALGICDPNDAGKPHELLPYAEAEVSEALTSKGARFIFEQLDQYELEVSPIGVQADHSELLRLAALLPHVEPTQLSPGLRRLISHVVDELDLACGDLVDTGAVDDAPDEVSPIVIGQRSLVSDSVRPG